MAVQDHSRRRALQIALGAFVLSGYTAGGATAFAADRRGEEFPEVPGMSGDRRANELWYQFNVATLYEQSADVREAYAQINGHFGGNLPVTLRENWFAMYREPDYPRNYAAFMAPVTRALRTLSRVQLEVFDTYYPIRRRLVEAFSFFGQGTLFDPRERVGLRVHTMDARPGEAPTAYHTWYLFMRAMMLLGIDTDRWRRMAPLLAFAWAVQNTALPAMDEVNPPLPADTLRRLACTWLPTNTRQLDAAFQSFPAPPDTVPRR
ncbi:hypothetical protein [Streptomyces sp. F-3]|uniref:hypothetical protein n=1 Tax=Streptomyces sp. F-3 TaxID=1840095 RepID=UPI00099F7351|nr:hypothetical protein [Streptomyces sp. F-3]